jgi:hypothetical protein
MSYKSITEEQYSKITLAYNKLVEEYEEREREGKITAVFCDDCKGDLDWKNSKGRVCRCRCECGWIYNRCYKTYTNGKCKHIK